MSAREKEERRKLIYPDTTALRKKAELSHFQSKVYLCLNKYDTNDIYYFPDEFVVYDSDDIIITSYGKVIVCYQYGPQSESCARTVYLNTRKVVNNPATLHEIIDGCQSGWTVCCIDKGSLGFTPPELVIKHHAHFG